MRQEIKQWTNRKTYAKMDKKRGMHCETRSACRPPQGNACLLVLFGHVLSGVRTAGVPTPAFFVGVERFLWSFHIDLFIFLSGYVFRITGGATVKGSRLRFVGSKVIDLGFLYATFNCVLAFGIGTCLPALEPQKLPLFMRDGKGQPSALYSVLASASTAAAAASFMPPRSVTVGSIKVRFLLFSSMRCMVFAAVGAHAPFSMKATVRF